MIVLKKWIKIIKFIERGTNVMKNEKIKTVDGKTLMDMKLPQIRYIVKDLLPQGLHILAGAPKTGKSWLLLLLAIKVSQGELFWNLQTEKGTVLSLCLEDSLNRIQQRLFDLTEDAPENLHFATLSKSLSNGLCDQIEEFIKDYPDTNLVIIDTLQKVRDSLGESNMYVSDYKDISLLKALADKYSIAIIVVHHLRKQFDSDPHNMVTGSTGLIGASDSSYVLKRENICDNDAKVYIKGRDIQEQVINIHRDEDTNEWLFVSSDTKAISTLKNETFFPFLRSYITTEKKFIGTVSELSLKIGANINGNVLSRKLNKYQKELKDMGITFELNRTGKRREIIITYDGNDDMTINIGCENKSSQSL